MNTFCKMPLKHPPDYYLMSIKKLKCKGKSIKQLETGVGVGNPLAYHE